MKNFKYLFLIIAGVFGLASYELIIGWKIYTHDSFIWYGSFHYYLASMVQGHFPYWDPYMMTGTYFYPNISFMHLLDPTVLLCLLAVKTTGMHPLTAYNYFFLSRLFLFVTGGFFLFRHVCRCRVSALLAAGVLLFAIMPTLHRQAGPLFSVFLTPFALYTLLLFFENIGSRKRYVYLSWFTLMTGITMNYYIPSYFLFNIIVFVIAVFVLRIVKFIEIVRTFRDRKLVIAVAASVVVMVMMTAPPLMVMAKDASGDGELFPMLRIVQKAGGFVKKIMASDISDNSLSESFTIRKGVFSSYGNMVNMVYPDVFESVPFFAASLAEVPQYIGIIPFLFALIALLYHTSRYRYLAVCMMVFIAVNMFSFSGMYSEYNLVQKLFNMIFPPLKMIDARFNFAPFFLLYLCMLSALGFSMCFDDLRPNSFLKEKYAPIAGLIMVIVLLKTAITWYFGDKIIYASQYDLFVIFQLVFFAVGLFVTIRKGIRGSLMKVFPLAVVLMIFVDFYYYSIKSQGYNLEDSSPYFQMIDYISPERTKTTFQYFREPMPAPPGLAYGESILKIKGVLTYGNNHSPFSTKRYYDLLTHVPLQNQLILSGVVSPIIRFFPEDAVVVVDDRRSLLAYFASADELDLVNHLFIEKGEKGSTHAGAAFSANLGNYEDIGWLHPANLYFIFGKFMNTYGGRIEEARNNLDRYLNTNEYSVEVREFSPNDITVEVNNMTDGYLYYNDGWSRYWKAYDGDREVPVEIANYNSKAVFLKKGQHLVRFVFSPSLYKMGLVSYYIGLFFSFAAIVFSGMGYHRYDVEDRPLRQHHGA